MPPQHQQTPQQYPALFGNKKHGWPTSAPAATTITPAVPSKPSWSSLFASSSVATPSSTTNELSKKPVASSKPPSSVNRTEFSLKLADFLSNYKSDSATVIPRPRGLINRSNYCYMNSILQALLGCSPLLSMIRSIPKQAANLCKDKTPAINALITFMMYFSEMPSGLCNAKVTKNKNGDLHCDPAFEPTLIYKLWNDSREKHLQGRQEDAEEFLSYILNKLNDEMLEVLKLIAKPKAEQNEQQEAYFGCTPVSDIFCGELRSRLEREGEQASDTIQPFFTLQLNIEKAASIKEALEILVGRNKIEGVTSSRTKQEVMAWQQMHIKKLPPILILHLKWFNYSSYSCRKIFKKVEFPVELKIDAKVLACNKYPQKQRTYRLYAVVYHDGKEATKGHYFTDVYHTGYGSWLRYDDSSVKPVSEKNVLSPQAPRVPYLLCYRRCDTIPQQQEQQRQQH